MHLPANLKQPQSPWPHKAKSPQCCLGTSGRKQPRRAGFPRSVHWLAPPAGGRGTRLPTGARSRDFLSRRAGPPLTKGSCPQLGLARELGAWLRPPLLSLSLLQCFQGHLNFPRTGSAYVKQELGSQVMCAHTCVVYAFYDFRRKHSAVRE